MDTIAHAPGSFCTSVLRTRDLERAAAFYADLVGWTSEEVPGFKGHRLLRFKGKTVASLQHASGAQDEWIPHASVESVERTTERAVSLGARPGDTIDVPGLARLATLRDPEGAVFGLWQPAPFHGAQLTEEVGSLWWIEVLSKNVAGACEFYGQLFGWTTRNTAFQPFDSYTVFERGNVQEGGVLPIGRGWDVSPRWNSIFAVDDCDARIARGESLGGSEIFVHTVPKHGRIGSLSDPGGALFVMRGPVPASSA